MQKRTRNFLILGTATIVLILIAVYGKKYEPTQEVPKTEAQIEQEELSKKINEGSKLYDEQEKLAEEYAKKANEALAEKERIRKYTSGYRKVLCEKYGKHLSQNGGLEAISDCSRFDTPTEPSFQ